MPQDALEPTQIQAHVSQETLKEIWQSLQKDPSSVIVCLSFPRGFPGQVWEPGRRVVQGTSLDGETEAQRR